MQSRLLIYIILFIGAAQGFLLSVALTTTSRGNKKANRVLASLLFIFSFIILFHSIGEIQQGKTIAEHSHSGQVFLLLVAPLIYYYTKILTTIEFTFSIKDVFHLIPFAIIMILYFVTQNYLNQANMLKVLDKIFLWSILVQMTLYLSLSIQRINSFSKGIENSFSSVDKINLHWLRFLILANALIWPVAFLIEIYKKNTQDFDVIWLLISTLIYLIGYKGLTQPEIFSGVLRNNETEAIVKKKKYEHSGLEPEFADSIYIKLKEYMSASKPFLEYNLTLPSLAKQLSVSTHHLSQVINEKTGQNFFEFINSHRVEEAKRLLMEPEKKHFTIASIGLEAGFNSISSFNSVFKKITGMTPSQFQKFSE